MIASICHPDRKQCGGKGLCRNCYMRQWNADHPKSRKGTFQRYRTSHRKQRNANNQAWRTRNIEQARASNRKRQKQPKVQALRRVSQANRHARKLGNGGTFTYQEWEILKQQHRHRCVGCWKTEAALKLIGCMLVPDHIIPLVNGGLNIIENIQPLCHGKGGCNLKKGRKYFDFLIS